jgi:hypothetical protein
MAKYGVTNVAGGGGIGSDEVTVTKEYVLNGKTYVGTDTNDEIGTGTMVNNGATANQSLNAGGSFQVKKGYHAQDFSVNANNLASQTSGTATSGHILSGQSAWVNGAKVNGGIPWQNADVSGTDRAWATNISCWDGTACLGVKKQHYLNGVNWIQGNIPNFYAGNIKKGVNMGGLVGTFEGYVPSATDLYLRGSISSLASGLRKSDAHVLDSGQITFQKTSATSQSTKFYGISTTKQINFTGYNYINVEFTIDSANTNVSLVLGFSDYFYNSSSIAADLTNLDHYTNQYMGVTYNRVISLPISTFQVNAYVFFGFQYVYQMTCHGAIYRIWLS